MVEIIGRRGVALLLLSNVDFKTIFKLNFKTLMSH